MQTEGLSSYAQQPVTGPYSEFRRIHPIPGPCAIFHKKKKILLFFMVKF
jgi:hypothetical protein